MRAAPRLVGPDTGRTRVGASAAAQGRRTASPAPLARRRPRRSSCRRRQPQRAQLVGRRVLHDVRRQPPRWPHLALLPRFRSRPADGVHDQPLGRSQLAPRGDAGGQRGPVLGVRVPRRGQPFDRGSHRRQLIAVARRRSRRRCLAHRLGGFQRAPARCCCCCLIVGQIRGGTSYHPPPRVGATTLPPAARDAHRGEDGAGVQRPVRGEVCAAPCPAVAPLDQLERDQLRESPLRGSGVHVGLERDAPDAHVARPARPVEAAGERQQDEPQRGAKGEPRDRPLEVDPAGGRRGGRGHVLGAGDGARQGGRTHVVLCPARRLTTRFGRG